MTTGSRPQVGSAFRENPTPDLECFSGQAGAGNFSRTRSHAIASSRGFVAIPLEIRFSTVLQRPYVLSMFIFMTDDTQSSRNANAPGGPGSLRTWRQLLGMALAAALIGAAGAAVWKAAHTTTAYQWYAVGMLVLSESLIGVGLNPRRPKEIRHADGSAETVTLEAIAGHPPLLALRERMIDDLLDAALIGLAVGAGIATAVLAALHYAGGRLKRGRRLRGGEPATARQLQRRVASLRLRLRRRFGRPSDRPRRIAERFAPWESKGEVVRTREVDCEAAQPGSKTAEGRPGEAKDVIGQTLEAEAAIDLWELDPPPPGNGNQVFHPDGAGARGNAGQPPGANALSPEPSFTEDAGAGEGAVGETVRTGVDPDSGPDEDGRPPGATANRADMRGRNSPAGARPEGGMIPI